MDPSVFDDLQQAVTTRGPAAAIDQLCEQLRQRKDYGSLFYALLMKKRHELGVSPIPTGPSHDLPPHTHQPFEEGIRAACREVGRLFLDDGNIPQAWVYFRMIGEPQPVAEALDACQPGETDDIQQLVQIAFYENVNPRKGFDWVLGRFGICNAITTVSSQELPHTPEVKEYCVRQLVRALHAELCERLGADIQRREGTAPATTSVRELLAGRDWLVQDEFAHVDTSHLSSVVQMSLQLTPCPELELARELCAYGERVPVRLRYGGDPPFDDTYRDYGIYLAILAGDKVEDGVAHFRTKAENADPETVGTYPAEVLVNLLLRLGRTTDALAVARRFLAKTDGRRLTCPGISELCQRANDYRTLAEVAREQGDPVHFLAGLLASR